MKHFLGYQMWREPETKTFPVTAVAWHGGIQSERNPPLDPKLRAGSRMRSLPVPSVPLSYLQEYCVKWKSAGESSGAWRGGCVTVCTGVTESTGDDTLVLKQQESKENVYKNICWHECDRHACRPPVADHFQAQLDIWIRKSPSSSKTDVLGEEVRLATNPVRRYLMNQETQSVDIWWPGDEAQQSIILWSAALRGASRQ